MSELEKRIKQKSFKHTWHTQHMNFLKDEILLDNLFTIIDEMRHEFPYRDTSKDDDITQCLLKLCKARHIWFVKWFGESDG